MPKGCLKRASTSLPSMSSMSSSDQESPLRRPTCCRKHVSFLEEGVAEVHVADEWDRTPVEMCAKLSYHDILELKEMQMQMARVNRKAHSINFPKILSAVPVGLMPLLPETPAPSPVHSPPPMSPSNTTSMNMVRPPSPPATPPRPALSSIPSPNPPRMKTFAFLPLLDTPPDSKPSPPPPPPASCPPTAKLTARTAVAPVVPPSPPSEAESSAKAPSVSYFPPQPKANGSNLAPTQASSSSSSVVQQHNITLHNPTVRKVRLQPLRSPALNPPSPFSLYPPSPRDSSDSDSEMEHAHNQASNTNNTKEFVLDLADLRSRREAMRLRQEREETRTWEPCNTLHFGPMDGL